jgi:serine protease AprX
MRVERGWLREVVFGRDSERRFTQESPILPDVWLVGGVQYCLNPRRRIDFLLTPHRERTAAALAQELQLRLDYLQRADEPRPVRGESGNALLITRSVWTLAVSQVSVAVSLTLEELVTAALPLTPWWERNRDDVEKFVKGRNDVEEEVRWMCRLVGILHLCAKAPGSVRERSEEASWFVDAAPTRDDTDDVNPLKTDPALGTQRATEVDARQFQAIKQDSSRQREAFVALARKALDAERHTSRTDDAPTPAPPLWSVGLNRRARSAIAKSVSSTKADAARLLFNVRCDDLGWAVVDTGIDARHPAFRGQAKKDGKKGEKKRTAAEMSRVKATYDFTRLRTLITLDSHPSTGPSSLDQGEDLEQADRRFKEMRLRLRSGRALDWGQIEPLVQIPHDSRYRPPQHDHGTHVAGILGACEVDKKDGSGMCPDIGFYDFRVLDENGQGDEFSIIAALQFIRHLNAVSDKPVIHGVNLSLSLIHDVENFACGRTPICEECERLVASGVVVVAAAGNRGFERVLTRAGELDAYRSISITDPGNADGVITVGATHRFEPHTYGVSYFSSRGPTGDGRIKPDVLAPGERIYSTVLENGYGPKDGTSMAAPHVSGVAAMLMARHREFVGQPAQIKRILMKTATDLGRERYFQGAGMVDALRALQSI